MTDFPCNEQVPEPCSVQPVGPAGQGQHIRKIEAKWATHGEFPDIRHPMFCVEQIIIPYTFPQIMKNYAKAVIRTKPYDLLRWSAAYFRCLAEQVAPPVKRRMEPEQRFGALTRGLLRTLRDQLGRGFFVDRAVLLRHWQALALPADDLLAFLSLCRMLHWPQVHWLKLFAVMVGSLCETLLDTLTVCCELLTDDVEGSPSPIPMWMLRECYVFLAELDCSEEQHFHDGRKIIEYNRDKTGCGEDVLEDPTEQPALPQLLSLDAFRNAIVEKFNARLGIKQNLSRNDFPFRYATPDPPPPFDPAAVAAAAEAAENDCACPASPVSSSFKFVGDFTQATQVLRHAPDFDTVILLLHEQQGYQLHHYRADAGPGAITDATRRHAERRERQQRERDQKFAAARDQHAEAVRQHERDALVAAVQPPWSWMHQFAAANTRDKSYNFLECDAANAVPDGADGAGDSLASGQRTPSSDSSDESFDFERNCFHQRRLAAEAAGRKAERDRIEALLLGDGLGGIDETTADGAGDTASDAEAERAAAAEEVLRIIDVDTLLDDVIRMLEQAIARKLADLNDTASVATFFEGADDEQPGGFNLRKVRVALRHAEERGVRFASFAEMRRFLLDELQLADSQADLCRMSLTEVMSSIAPTAQQSATGGDGEENGEEQESLKTEAAGEEGGGEAMEEEEEPDRRQPMPDYYPECQLVEIADDDTPGTAPASTAPSADQLPLKVIGLIATPPPTPPVEPTPPRTPTSVPETPHDTTSGIITANVSVDGEPRDRAPLPAVAEAAALPPPPFECQVRAMPGIGPAVGVRVVRVFVTYLARRAREEPTGLVYPRHFRERGAPHAVETRTSGGCV